LASDVRKVEQRYRLGHLRDVRQPIAALILERYRGSDDARIRGAGCSLRRARPTTTWRCRPWLCDACLFGGTRAAPRRPCGGDSTRAALRQLFGWCRGCCGTWKYHCEAFIGRIGYHV
jgi:hypothetical protein